MRVSWLGGWNAEPVAHTREGGEGLLEGLEA